MNKFIAKLFEKRGIKGFDELDDSKLPDGSLSEKATFQQWEKTLSKQELTLEDVKTFCNAQVQIIENKWKDFGVANERKAELIPYHTVYKTLLLAIESPKVERALLEQQLEQLTK